MGIPGRRHLGRDHQRHPGVHRAPAARGRLRPHGPPRPAGRRRRGRALRAGQGHAGVDISAAYEPERRSAATRPHPLAEPRADRERRQVAGRRQPGAGQGQAGRCREGRVCPGERAGAAVRLQLGLPGREQGPDPQGLPGQGHRAVLVPAHGDQGRGGQARRGVPAGPRRPGA